jgi:protein-S-isoprenylcysteine O-methyltransferase Ste14
LIGLWGVLLVWTFRNLGKNLTDTVVTRKDHTLVTTGPYRYVRHPFYLAFFLAVIGGSIVAANWFVFLAGMIPSGFLIARTRIEEEKLTERFGEEYRDYVKTTGRFFPRLLW